MSEIEKTIEELEAEVLSELEEQADAPKKGAAPAEPNLKASRIMAYVAPIRTLSIIDKKLNKFEFGDGLILIINSIIMIIKGTITNSFRPSEMNLVTKFANKK